MRLRTNSFSLLFYLIIFWSQSVNAEKYITDNISCDGYKRVLVGTTEGTCLGLVVQASSAFKLIKPRKIIQVAHKKQFLIVDMGGWNPHKGILWLLDVSGRKPKLTPLLKKLNLPHGLAKDNKGRFYVGEKHQIFRFSLQHGKIKNKQVVISGLPDWKGHRHPLSHFIFDNHYNLIVNTAAPSDQCKKNVRADKSCGEIYQHESVNGSLRKYIYDQKKDTFSKKYEVIATGLRNSMALAQHSSGTLLQAENSMDFGGLHTPFEELNVIKKGKFYGWPYCYDKKSVNPFWKVAAKKYCLKSSAYQEPWVVVAPHAAPLDMLYYQGNKFPELKGKLVMSWHGYRRTGHRVVFYDVDALGKPKRVSRAVYSLDPVGRNTIFKKYAFPSSQNVAQAHEIVSSWNAVNGVRPRGRPVGMTVADDGAIWILDDVNKAVLRLSKGLAFGKMPNTTNIKASGIYVANKKAANLFQSRCSSCHTNIVNQSKVYLPASWLQYQDGKNLLSIRLFGSVLPKMPPDKALNKAERTIFSDWIDQYKASKR